VPGARASRGFIFPFSMAKTNNPYWYHPQFDGKWTAVKNTVRADSSALGLAGYSVTTRDTLSTLKISFRGDAYPGYTFTRVKVLHDMDSSYAVEAWSPVAGLAIDKHTDVDGGYTEFTYSAHTDTLFLRFIRTDSTQRKFTLYGISLETDDPGIVYHAIGVNGASTSSYLRCQRFVPDLALLKPDLVVFSIGINDAHAADFSAARYKSNYAELIQRVRQAAPDAAILFTTNTDSYIKRRTVNPNGAAVREVMLQLGSEQGCAVWDCMAVMGGPGSIAQWQKAGLAQADRIHLTRQGYVALGGLLYAALMENYAAHIKRTYRP
jgi:lysophospholipase L1-like esterase